MVVIFELFGYGGVGEGETKLVDTADSDIERSSGLSGRARWTGNGLLGGPVTTEDAAKGRLPNLLFFAIAFGRLGCF